MKSESYFLFSGGEVHLKVDYLPSKIIVTDYTMNGFMALAQTVEVSRRMVTEKIDVVYPYFPYARQDRVMVDSEPFSLKIFCDMVNALKLDSVTIWDPHSDVTPALLNNCKVVPQWDLARMTLPSEYFSDENHVFICPDAGAYKKISKLITDDKRIVIATKSRNASGNITSTRILEPHKIEGKHCVIVDDICDGGRTFVELAKALKRELPESITLYVTHGIFSKGFDELQKYIGRIYTTNSFNHKQNDYLFVREIP